MGQHNLTMLVVVLLAGATVAATGCRHEPTHDAPSAGAAAGPPASSGDHSAAVANPEPPPKIPQVALTDTLLATCLVKVGDVLPQGELPDLDGKPQILADLLGKKLTVLFFWTADNPYSRREVEDLTDFTAPDMAANGVAVIGINHGDKPDTIRKVLAEAGAKYPVLQDPQGAYFHKLATEKVLRTYLLDAQGKILWFDLEYSQGTQRDLPQAVSVALGKRG